MLTLISAATMSAQTTADVTLRLESESHSVSDLYLFSGPDLVASPERGSFYATQSNPEDINIYAVDPATNGKYSSYGNGTLMNIPVEIITSKEAAAKQNYTIKFEVYEDAEVLKLKDLVTGEEKDIVDGGSYNFTVTEGNAPSYQEGTYSVISNRFVINYTYVTMKGDFANPGAELAYTSNFTHNGATASLNLDLAADTWYHFQIEENGAVGANGSAFDEDHKSFEVPATGWVGQLTLHTGAAGTYTFTWTYASDNLAITFPAVAPATGYTVTPNAAGYATFSAAEATVIPTGATAYTGTISGEELLLNQIMGGYVPANTGVIVSGVAGTPYNFAIYDGSVDAITGNDLKATATYNTSMQNVYVLKGNAFLEYVGTNALAANKAFIQLPAQSGAPTRIRMVVNHATGVENAAVEAKAEKFVENGQILIRRGNEVYNLQGQIVQ